ncbi:Bis(5'-nucleosyl)-tetraphosphatase, symmetrical [Fusarium oxysporum f. sp. cubense race 1]|uniref:Bis(5'-nucleosyl)-tetraphosphatase, symmetrical n=1 Tax=Fusarium oxysporum f. sp. cubense (strain race 1) TaxID=1229664 RepID=N4UJR8_FUSC1|nr:Bis(5'-nucleosyl)-tetraphosphatase, symmetrical [Fusarium oxysporum f. sp. cubense race 1]
MPSHENEYEINTHSSTAHSHAGFPWYPLQTRIQDVIAPGRLIIVGDVHGRLPELKELVEKVAYSKPNGDKLILVGDLINKGPDSPGVVQLAMELGASAIRGNNEDRVLAAHSAIKRGDDTKLVERLKRLAREAEKENDKKDGEPAPSETKDDLKSISPEDLKPYSSESDFTTAANLSDEQISWLASQPLVLRIKLRKGATSPPWNSGTLLVAHGGLVPLLPLEEQDSWAVMNMRGLVYPDPEATVTEPIRVAAYGDVNDADIKAELLKWADIVNNGEGFSGQYKEGVIGFPLETREGDWWIDAWNRWQNSIRDPEKRSIVVYGHDARVGIQVGADSPEVARYTFGLDSGCVYGKSLTAMIIDEKEDGKGLSHSIVQVDAIKKDEGKEGEAV